MADQKVYGVVPTHEIDEDHSSNQRMQARIDEVRKYVDRGYTPIQIANIFYGQDLPISHFGTEHRIIKRKEMVKRIAEQLISERSKGL